MRNAFLDALHQLAIENKNLMLLTADLGYGVFDDFEKQFPRQYLNVGIAEQNMIGVASGLALEGKKVFVYSIGNFPTLRCLEQIRNDACYHDLNVNIVAMGGGFSYGALGMSHHAIEDIAIMKSLPNLKIAVPTTADEVKQATIAMANDCGVGYLRLDKSSAIAINNCDTFEFGKATVLLNGNDYVIFVIGGIAEEALKAAIVLKEKNISLKVISLASVKPLDIDLILSEIKVKKGLMTLEEGTITNGLSSSIADICLENKILPKNFKKFGVDDQFISIVGNQNYLREKCKLTSNDICEVIFEWENR